MGVNIKIDLKETEWDDLDYIHVALEREKRGAVPYLMHMLPHSQYLTLHGIGLQGEDW
jgi:hypothetical protein